MDQGGGLSCVAGVSSDVEVIYWLAGYMFRFLGSSFSC